MDLHADLPTVAAALAASLVAEDIVTGDVRRCLEGPSRAIKPDIEIPLDWKDPRIAAES